MVWKSYSPACQKIQTWRPARGIEMHFFLISIDFLSTVLLPDWSLQPDISQLKCLNLFLSSFQFVFQHVSQFQSSTMEINFYLCHGKTGLTGYFFVRISVKISQLNDHPLGFG